MPHRGHRKRRSSERRVENVHKVRVANSVKETLGCVSTICCVTETRLVSSACELYFELMEARDVGQKLFVELLPIESIGGVAVKLSIDYGLAYILDAALENMPVPCVE